MCMDVPPEVCQKDEDVPPQHVTFKGLSFLNLSKPHFLGVIYMNEIHTTSQKQ